MRSSLAASSDQFDLAVAKAIDPANDLQLALLDSSTEDRRRRLQFGNVIDDVAPDRILELVTGLIHGRFHGRRDVGDQRRQMARQRGVVLDRFDRLTHGAATFVAEYHKQRHVEDRGGVF